MRNVLVLMPRIGGTQAAKESKLWELGLYRSYQHLQPRMVYVTDQGFAVKPASHILRMLRAVTAPPVIRVGSLSGVAATLPCFGKRAAGSNVRLKSGKRAAGSNVRLKRKKIRKDAAGVLSLTLHV